MLSKNQRLKFLLVLVVAQIGCLAVGLWIHYRFVVSAVFRSVEEEAIAELATGADELLTAIGRLKVQGPAAGPASLEQIEQLLQTKQTVPGVQWMLADSQWQILAVPQASDAESLLGESLGETLVWTSPPGQTDGDANRITGSLEMADGLHAAVARSLGSQEGYVVAHYPLGRSKVSPAVLVGSLPAIGVITWIWAGALLAFTVYMIVTRFFDELSKRHARAEAEALRHIQSLVRTRDAVIFGLAKLAEASDETTGQHLERIAAYASRLAATVRHHPKYCDVVTREFIHLIGISSVLHDIGKVGIEDSILLKPAALTQVERERMQQHTRIGTKCLLEIERQLGTSNFLQMAREIALSHHERWDGTGYPEGLAGEEIPLAARIVAVADVYDALANRRMYKQAFPHQECVVLIRDEAGKQFDPDLVEAFLRIQGLFRQIARQYANDATGVPDPIPRVRALSEDSLCVGLVSVRAALEEGWSMPTTLPDQG